MPRAGLEHYSSNVAASILVTSSMSTNPIVNAAAATAYITLVATAMFYGSQAIFPAEDSVIMPIFFLSLLVLSASLMGYFFLYQPLQLMIDGKSKEGIRLFLLTLAAFACITGAMVLGWLLLSARL